MFFKTKLRQEKEDLEEEVELLKCRVERLQNEQTDNRFDDAISELVWKRQYIELQDKWNEVVQIINDKGGSRFLEEGVLPSNTAPMFTLEQLKQIRKLCHPDLHGNSTSSHEITCALNDVIAEQLLL